ncbi:hypothetical protein T459_07612 [Capsicum annuum]|uniref:Induced stolon tip protein PJ-1 n=1 Tax=Capsicum annuum TaxID=4072 RepID=Q6RJY0_CAPAN|nr:induced stolon tip protein PJ-1 [Capsicum annuum]PHT85506.1 hypothetical protein T459_07612 [Capsicum annuum]
MECCGPYRGDHDSSGVYRGANNSFW